MIDPNLTGLSITRRHFLTSATTLGLGSLGLAVARPDGIGISRLGRELVINTLLEVRPADKDPR